MGWKPEVLVQGQWSRNGLVFATEKEAACSAMALSFRWLLVEDTRAVEVDEEPTHTFTAELGEQEI